MTDIYEKINDLYDRRRRAELGGGDERIARQHEKGKLTARERIELLLDEDTFVELNPFIEHRSTDFGLEEMKYPGDGVVTGYGKINGRPVYLFSQDFTVFGGALGEMHAEKIAKAMDLAAKNGAPFIGLNDSGGARIQEGVVSLDGYGHVFYRNAIYSGVIPQISASAREKWIAGDELRPDLADTVPYDAVRPYDVRAVIDQVVDDNSFFEVQKEFAKNIVIGFARIRGEAVGLVCNQPKFLAGGLDIDSSDKAARFIRFCDSFNIPIITFEDVTGFFPGVKQEHGGIIRHGAKILYAYSEATVPKITVILRKAYGGAYVALNSKSIGADLVFAWPNAEIAVMGPQGAANIIFAREIAQSENPEKIRKQKITDYREKFANPYVAAAHGMVDDVIDPRETRLKLIQALEMLHNKKDDRPRKKHGNIPL